jgi:chromosome segregation protein
MYFKKLELLGFKSFMEKTTLHFEPGVTAIVGPNGCGKSNIFDAIRWVLGEQSVKSLRGSSMEDVIFNGTDFKQPLGMAEVSLTFDNDSKFFSLDHDEVIVTRKIFRSGESEYFINKAQVRLKDILDLLMGTGIGAESYSLVAQGKIDLILSSRPEDRRLVFDEASGITRYKTQKREAARKLEDTEQNLLRINDIITEVKRQIGSLERQANKARRYKEVFEEAKTKEINLAVLQRNNLSKQKEEINSRLDELKNKEELLQAAILEEEAGVSRLREELKVWEDEATGINNQLLNLENLILRDKQHITLNRQRIEELERFQKDAQEQITQAKSRLEQDESKLNKLKEEHMAVKKDMEEKSYLLEENQSQLESIVSQMKASLESIAQAKKNIMDFAAQSTHAKNEITDLSSRQQIHLARKKRLDIEKLKAREERSQIEENLNNLLSELSRMEADLQDSNFKISGFKNELNTASLSLSQVNSDLDSLEKQKVSLESQKEFLEKLKMQYEGIDTSMNAVVYLDKLPNDKLTGLVIKIKDVDEPNLKFSGEAKPMDLDTQRVIEKIRLIEESIAGLRTLKAEKEASIEQLNQAIKALEQKTQEQEIAVANKKTSHQSILEQFNKIKEEEEIADMELSDVDRDLVALGEKLSGLNAHLSELDAGQKAQEDFIHNEQEKSIANNKLKEDILVIITKTRTEVETLAKRMSSEEVTLKMLEDAYEQDKEGLLNLQRQIEESGEKKEILGLEIKDLEDKIIQAGHDIETQNTRLKEGQEKYGGIQADLARMLEKITQDKKEMDALKESLYSLQMESKDLDFKNMSIKDRIMQGYKVDIELQDIALPEINEDALSQEIQVLKDKLDSYGTVNLVAIEEYDELKKRYDFLTQQQNDLVTSRDSLKEAIQKINRTTKEMFCATFEKIQTEFKNYFRLLFNGGDAQLFLIDEHDPLESGIEIICRPPGKKLQNVLLLSGGEKTMSAIALIFAIFKIKPAPFCVLDEIDAALDEANVDRYSRLLQEFTGSSQFIIITHNKKTIANADVMYGITMEESGVSKIVSVKFSSDKAPVAAKAKEESGVLAAV